MAHTTLKLLGATTALLALSTAAMADDINTNNTTALQTSLTTTGYNVSGTVTVSNTAGLAAIEVSGTSTQNVILVSSSATVTANTTSGTINTGGVGQASGATATITNRGAINATGGSTVAVSLSTLSGAVTLSNTGTISGSVTTGSGDDVITLTGGSITGDVSTSLGADTLTVQSGATITGNVTLGDGANNVLVSGSTSSIVGNISALTSADYVTSTNALINGNVNLGDGNNVIEVTGTSGKISGTVTTTAGNDRLIVTNATIADAIDLGAGNNTAVISGTSATTKAITTGTGNATLTVNGARVNGDITTGTGDATVTLTNATISGSSVFGDGTNAVTATGSTISGSVTFGTGNDALTLINSSAKAITFGTGTDQLNVSGSTAFTMAGAFSGLEKMYVSTTAVTAGYSLGTTMTNLGLQNATMDINENQNIASAAITANNSTLNIAAGKVVTATTAVFSNAGVLGVHVATSQSAGKLALSGALTGVSATIRLASNAGYINSGTAFQIVNAGAASILPSLTTSTQGLYTFQLANDGNNGVSLTILRAATSTAATNDSNANIARVMDGISSTTNAQLVGVQNALGNATTSAGVNSVLETLNPAGGAGAAMAGAATGSATGNQVSNRLAMLRGNKAGMNTGDGMFSNHFWVQGFGNVTSQDDKDGTKGYDATGYGTTVGLDTDTLMPDTTVGAAFSYGQANVESNAAGNAETDVNTYMLTGYGATAVGNGVFVNGQANIAKNAYETNRSIAGVGSKAMGEFDGMQYGLKGEIGRDYDFEAITLTPVLSAQYTHIDMDKYTETGAGGAGLVVNDQSFDGLDLGAGANLAWNLPLENGGLLKPMLRAKYIYRAGDDTVETTSRFIGGGSSFTTQGVKADKSSMNLGTGLMLTTVGGVDLSLDYDADLRSSLTAHTGQVKARWAF
ncbi:MAG: autotransporter domain-containing protein [Alphaproteobacteria bacterium]